MLIYNFQEYIAELALKVMKKDSKVAYGKQDKEIIYIIILVHGSFTQP